MIPKQLQKEEFRFLLIKYKAKEPIESKWESENCYKFSDNKLQKHISSSGNYGVVGGYGNLIIIDADSEEIMEICEKKLPHTFTIQTSKEYKRHYYFIAEKQIKPIRLSKERIGDLGDVRSIGQYVVGANSIHPSGKIYKVIKDVPISYITETEIRNIFFDLIDKNASTTITKNYEPDTTLRSSPYIKNCRMPDYCAKHKLKGNTSKNWQLFPYLVDILHNRQTSKNYYIKILNTQGHSIGAIKGWVQMAGEGKLMKGSCKKMKGYIKRYHPELEEEICGRCKLHQRIKKIEEMERANEFNYRL